MCNRSHPVDSLIRIGHCLIHLDTVKTISSCDGGRTTYVNYRDGSLEIFNVPFDTVAQVLGFPSPPPKDPAP